MKHEVSTYSNENTGKNILSTRVASSINMKTALADQNIFQTYTTYTSQRMLICFLK